MKCFLDENGNLQAGHEKILVNCLEVLYNLQKNDNAKKE